MAAAKDPPKDAQVMAAILKDMGVTEHEPRVINQMLEFTYSKLYSALRFSFYLKFNVCILYYRPLVPFEV